MKKVLTFAICFCLSLSMTACSSESDSPPIVTPTLEAVVSSTASPEENESENEAMQDTIEFGLTINNTYYSIPRALKQYLDDGWSISEQTPYFLHPMVSEDYYDVRANWSLTEDGQRIYPGGSIIRLLEKDGVLLEVTIANQVDPSEDGKEQKIEDGVVDSITVFYDEAHTSIKLNDVELSSLTPESLLAAYPGSDGWTHTPSDYSNHPEFGTSINYDIEHNLDYCNRTISIYFDLDYTAFKVTVWNQTPLKHSK